jgi:gamma-glutamyltranspeptidase/glutathione hydrolase
MFEPAASETHTPFIFASRRSPVYATGGMVAASQPLAAQAGLEMLRRGGTAADAAVATAAALAVLEPCSTGLGGDGFALYHEAGTGRVHALNGSGRCPAALDLKILAARGLGPGAPIPPRSALAVTVPGALSSWCALMERFGVLGMDAALEAAERLAHGFAVGPVTAELWAEGAAEQLSVSPGGTALLVASSPPRAPRAGEVFCNPDRAGVLGALRRAARDGAAVTCAGDPSPSCGPAAEARAVLDAFYRGDPAARIAAAVQAAGGVLAAEDLAAHRAEWTEPVSAVFGGVRLFECPPNGQGLAALIALRILAALGEPKGDPLGPARLHNVIQALRLAFDDVRRHVADPAFGEMPVAELVAGLLAEERIAARAALVSPGSAALPGVQGAPGGSETVYFCAVDRRGNACSMVNSNFTGFGTGIVPEGLGFSLQNRGIGFSLDPAHANALAPGKRPYHTIIPAMALREADGSLYGPMGVMGAFMQPQGHVQVLLALAEGLDPQAALDRPRLCLPAGTAGDEVRLEEGVPEATQRALAALGHDVSVVRGYDRKLFGRGQIILRDPASGVLCAGSDPRADGFAAPLP